MALFEICGVKFTIADCPPRICTLFMQKLTMSRFNENTSSELISNVVQYEEDINIGRRSVGKYFYAYIGRGNNLS